MGNAFTFTGDFSKALEAAGRVFELLDRKPRIDANHSVGLKLNQVEGKLRIRDGEFSYPTRKDIQVLNRLNLSVKTGEKNCFGRGVRVRQVHCDTTYPKA